MFFPSNSVLVHNFKKGGLLKIDSSIHTQSKVYTAEKVNLLFNQYKHDDFICTSVNMNTCAMYK